MSVETVSRVGKASCVPPHLPPLFFPRDSFVQDLRDGGDSGETEPVQRSRVMPGPTALFARTDAGERLVSAGAKRVFLSLPVCPAITSCPQPAPAPLSGLVQAWLSQTLHPLASPQSLHRATTPLN